MAAATTCKPLSAPPMSWADVYRHGRHCDGASSNGSLSVTSSVNDLSCRRSSSSSFALTPLASTTSPSLAYAQPSAGTWLVGLGGQTLQPGDAFTYTIERSRLNHGDASELSAHHTSRDPSLTHSYPSLNSASWRRRAP